MISSRLCLLAGALFRLSQANVEVIGTTFEHDEEYGSYVISCAAPKYDAVKEVAVLTVMLGNGTRLPSISVTEVQQTRLGAVAMCVAPIYTNRANMQVHNSDFFPYQPLFIGLLIPILSPWFLALD